MGPQPMLIERVAAILILAVALQSDPTKPFGSLMTVGGRDHSGSERQARRRLRECLSSRGVWGNPGCIPSRHMTLVAVAWLCLVSLSGHVVFAYQQRFHAHSPNQNPIATHQHDDNRSARHPHRVTRPKSLPRKTLDEHAAVTHSRIAVLHDRQSELRPRRPSVPPLLTSQRR